METSSQIGPVPKGDHSADHKPKDNKLPLAYQGARVDLWLQGATDEAKIKQEVAKLFNVIPALLIMKVGNVPWNASMDLDEEEVIEVGILSRGGMQRSVSTTLRWDEGSGSTDSPESRHFPRARSSRSRSRHERAREDRAAQGQPPTFYSSANPVQPLPAQEECISRPVRDQANLVGRVNATPHADPDDVMLDMNAELRLAEMPVFFPRDASEWQAVDYVLMQPQPPVGRAVVVDLRQDTWERYQYPRTMPVMEEGAVVTYLVVPDGLSMRQVQTRVNAWSTSIDLHIVMALDCYQWIVNRVTIPDSYRNAILEQRQRDLALPRGGAEFLYPIPVHIPVPEERKLIFTIFAHDPFQVNAYYIKKNTRLWHIMDHLEGEHHAWGRIRISTMLFPIHLDSQGMEPS